MGAHSGRLSPIAGEDAEAPRELATQRGQLPCVGLAALVTPAGIDR